MKHTIELLKILLAIFVMILMVASYATAAVTAILFFISLTSKTLHMILPTLLLSVFSLLLGTVFYDIFKIIDERFF